jgi:hypothetical protein
MNPAAHFNMDRLGISLYPHFPLFSAGFSAGKLRRNTIITECTPSLAPGHGLTTCILLIHDNPETQNAFSVRFKA